MMRHSIMSLMVLASISGGMLSGNDIKPGSILKYEQLAGNDREGYVHTLVQQYHKVVFRFTAPDCTICKKTVGEFRKLAEQYPDIVCIDVNYRDYGWSKALVSKYNIKSLPAFFFYRDGEYATVGLKRDAEQQGRIIAIAEHVYKK